jgi:ubiquinone/menaquinone biosynthesis C-methylase UbiE
MSDADKAFAGSIPEFYDTYMVPLIFEAYAEDMAARVASIAPRSVLETAAGSGVVPRSLIKRLHPGDRYVVTDLNQSMLDHAARRQTPDKRIEWRQADALDLPFEDDSFDAVVCQFGAMFFPDRIKGYSEARRVLRKGGSFFFNVWDKIENNEFADVVTDAAGKMFPDDPPQFLARTPHGYFKHDLISEDLSRAGFSEFAIVTKEESSRAPSARQVAVAYCQGTPLRNEIEARDRGSLQHVVDSATAALEARFGMGAVAARICAHVVTSSK